MIELAADIWRVQLRPEIGGAVSAMHRGGVPILRTMPDQADHPFDAACFPLVPYCNRIANGRFGWAERPVALAPNLSGHPHPLHGMGWLSQWHLIRHDKTSALMEHAYDGSGDWPWPYVAHQHVSLDSGGCTIRLMVQNLAHESAPVGIGFHPYFHRTSETVVRFAAEAMLGIDGDCLADGTRLPRDVLAPWSSGTALPDTLVDNCFETWDGLATIADERGTIEIRAFGAPHCHVYAPPGGEELCIEPVNHVPDALNADPRGMPFTLPGCAVGMAMRVASAGA